MAQLTLDQCSRTTSSYSGEEVWVTKHFTLFPVHSVTRIHHDRYESSFFKNTTGWHWQTDRMGGYRFYSSLIAHGGKVSLRLSSKNQSFKNIFQRFYFFFKPLNVAGLIAGSLWLYISFFQRPFEVSAQIVSRPATLGCLWTYGGAGVCAYMWTYTLILKFKWMGTSWQRGIFFSL